RRHRRFSRDWSSDVCSSDLKMLSDLLVPELRQRQMGNYIAFVPVSVDGELPVEEIAKQIHERIREFKTHKIDVSLFSATEAAVQIGRASCRGGAERAGGGWR